MHIFVHLLNDYSGSPRIMNEKISCYAALGEECLVITNADRGFIKTADHRHHLISYEKSTHRVVWLARLLLWHVKVFLLLLRRVRRGDVLHASTMLTAPHLVAARLKGARTVAHIMETRVSPRLHRWLMTRLIAAAADRIVYLSRYVEQVLAPRLGRVPAQITYPCVDPALVAAAEVAPPRREDAFHVGLICSLVWYKGFAEFVALARRFPGLAFVLVLNGDADVFETMVPRDRRPPNLTVHFNLSPVTPVLRKLDLLLSLTNREGWVETFGLTLIEAMAFGVPVIAPAVGAPLEFVEDGRNGYLVDERDLDAVAALVARLADDRALCARLGQAAAATAQRFTPERFRHAIADERAFVTASRIAEPV
ncbi:glycosyltransferase family 4 protein [Sphingomonas sp. DT-51]|uniref:glycosyltransferase family 4 protein n=1 Tax=Sphingomonas sp. DT-51 TaxID=3396165 RepID=UPI003F1E0902